MVKPNLYAKVKGTGQEEPPRRAPLRFHLAGNQAVLKVVAATKSGGSRTLAFPSLILTVCKGWLQMQKLIALPEPLMAVIAVSDRAAFGALEAIKDAGLVCPDNISVVGIDDVRDSA